MVAYSELAFRLFGGFSENIEKYFADLKQDLRRSDIRVAPKEYLSKIIFTGMLIFLVQLPIFSFLFGFLFASFLFGFLFAITVSLAATSGVFFFLMNYPRLQVSSKAKKLDNSLPFATLYLSTIAGSHLPIHEVLEIFPKFSTYDEINTQVNAINEDVRVLGMDVNTALERSVERSPSKNFRELVYGILATIRSGADLVIYLNEKAKTFMAEYRRSLVQYSQSLTVYIEIYLTALVLGTIFFTILTAIISGISGGAGNIVALQFLLVFIFMPAISLLFIYLVKSSAPGGE